MSSPVRSSPVSRILADFESLEPEDSDVILENTFLDPETSQTNPETTSFNPENTDTNSEAPKFNFPKAVSKGVRTATFLIRNITPKINKKEIQTKNEETPRKIGKAKGIKGKSLKRKAQMTKVKSTFKGFKCNYCNWIFKSRTLIAKHYKDVHQGQLFFYEDDC